MWGSWGEQAKASLSQALEKTENALNKTGDALSKAATRSGSEGQATPAGAANREGSAAAPSEDKPSGSAPLPPAHPQVLHNLQSGWSNVLSSTKQGWQQAEQAVKEQQTKLSRQLEQAKMRAHQRDINAPLDKAALRDTQVVYVTDRIITMAHPCLDSQADKRLSGPRKLAAVAHLLQQRHSGKFMVWNLSEVDYDTTLLQNQVLVYSFPGSPAPPLGLWLKILTSIEAWLRADDTHVAVVHCLTGQGRTSLVVASFLAWMAQAKLDTIPQALEYVAQCKQLAVDELIIPSQRRYASYLSNMLDNIRPSVPPLVLKRVILSTAPRLARGPPVEGKDSGDEERMGCAPYLQVFVRGKLLKTAAATRQHVRPEDKEDDNDDTAEKPKSTPVPFCTPRDGNLTFCLDQVVRGDILLRCRHLTPRKQRESVFRAAVHTGYVGGSGAAGSDARNVVRLTKAQLDGASEMKGEQVPDDFFVDLVWEAADDEEEDGKNDDAKASADGKEAEKHKVTASAEDCMLDRDSRFWDVIAERKTKTQQVAAASETDEGGEESRRDPFWGPTVGRRRDFAAKEDDDSDAAANAASAASPFTIGGDAFLDSGATTPTQQQQQPKKPDSLMQALMGVLDEPKDDDNAAGEAKNQDTTEEVVFFDDDAAVVPEVGSPEQVKAAAAATTPAATDAATSTTTTTPTPAKEATTPVAATAEAPVDAGDIDVAALLADDDDDMDMDALLGSDNVDDLLNLDVDDTDLDDLDSFLKS